MLLFLLAAGALLVGRAVWLSAERRAALDERAVETTRAALRAVVGASGEFARFVVEYELAVPEVTGALREGIESGDLAETRALLIERFQPLYERLRDSDFRQLHVHLPDGRSLLRMHAPDRWGDPLFEVRASVRIANEERVSVSGFEEGRVSNGYRFVYPLEHKGTHVGSVELGVSYEAVARELDAGFNTVGELIVSRSVVESTVFASERGRYLPSGLSDEYLVDGELERRFSTPFLREARDAVARRASRRLSGDDGFAVPFRTDAGSGVAAFVPIRNVSGEHVAWFVSYELTEAYRDVVLVSVERGVLLLLGMVGIASIFLRADRRRREAEAGDEARARFLANVSHELRTPMNGVMGMISALEEDDLSQAQRARYLRLLRGAADDLLYMVNSILEMSRLEAGGVTLHREPFSLANLVRDVAGAMERSDVAEGLALRLRIDPGVPETVVGDRLRVRQVVVNCLHNALKFTREGGVTIDLRATVTDDRTEAQIVITDTGIGIPESELRHIFEKFRQADASVTHSFGGSGLGLSIVAGLLEIMNGTIDVRSVEGVGTTVTLSLPFERPSTVPESSQPAPAAAAPQQPRSTRASRPPAAGHARADRLRVLVVEDDAVSRSVATSLLERHGFEVTTCTDGARAIHLARSGTFDVILMDRRLPGVDGVEATRELIDLWRASDEPPIPIIGVSGGASPEEREECIAAGMGAFVAKPIRIDDLLSAIREVTGAEPIQRDRVASTFSDPRELVDEVIPIFLAQSAERLLIIDRGVADRDAPLVHSQTHPLKTAALYLGAVHLSELARTIDDACRGDEGPDWSTIEPLVRELRAEVERIERWRSARAS